MMRFITRMSSSPDHALEIYDTVHDRTILHFRSKDIAERVKEQLNTGVRDDKVYQGNE